MRVVDKRSKVVRTVSRRTTILEQTQALYKHDPEHWIYHAFKNDDLYVVGSGPSLIGFDWEFLRDKNTFVLNHTITRVPNPKVHIFLDSSLPGKVGLNKKTDPWKTITKPGNGFENSEKHLVVRTHNRIGLRLCDGMYSGFNTGLFAVNLALLTGASRIFLLGIDGCVLKGEKVQALKNYAKTSYFYKADAKKEIDRKLKEADEQNTMVGHEQSGKDNSKKEFFQRSDSRLDYYKEQCKKFAVYSVYPQLVNCSPISEIPGIKKSTLDKELKIQYASNS